MTIARSHWGRIGLVVGVALMVRLVAAVVIDRQVARTPGRVCLIEGDAAGYWELGRKIVHGEDYVLYDPPRSVLRMPGFPVVLAVSQFLFGENLFAARCMLSLIGALTCGLVYRLGCEVATDGVALLASLGTALSPPLIAFSPLLLSETTFAATLTANLLTIAWMFSERRRSIDLCATGLASASNDEKKTLAEPVAHGKPSVRFGLAILVGLTGALATYMRPTWLPVVPVAAVMYWVLGRLDRRRSYEAVVMVLSLVVGMSPWMIRNAVVTGHVVITTLWDGPSLYDGLHPGATGESDMRFFEQEQLLDRMSEYEMNSEYRQRAWAFVTEHPGQTVRLAVSKGRRFWSLFPNAAQFADARLRWGLFLATLPLFVLAAIGAWVKRRDVVTLALTAGPILFFGAVHLLFIGSIRYRLPAEYPLWILAAMGSHALWLRWRSSPAAEG